jgi:hypothetical protein
VLTMSPERADKLRQEFGGQIVVEPDADLTLNRPDV